MKGFLTFTLAAGVAISTTTVVQAAGITKGAASANKAPATAQGPMTVGSMSIGIDRFALSRELNRLNQMLAPQEGIEGIGEEADSPVTAKTAGVWTW